MIWTWATSYARNDWFNQLHQFRPAPSRSNTFGHRLTKIRRVPYKEFPASLHAHSWLESPSWLNCPIQSNIVVYGYTFLCLCVSQSFYLSVIVSFALFFLMCVSVLKRSFTDYIGGIQFRSRGSLFLSSHVNAEWWNTCQRRIGIRGFAASYSPNATFDMFVMWRLSFSLPPSLSFFLSFFFFFLHFFLSSFLSFWQWRH